MELQNEMCQEKKMINGKSMENLMHLQVSGDKDEGRYYSE